MKTSPPEPEEPEGLRLLVACAACSLQYDAAGKPPGSCFHCACGTLIRVPHPRSSSADVVRCSSCGAARRKGSSRCSFCKADFTLHERDLHTVCPGCLTRISDNARYCHHCGMAIQPTGPAGEKTEYGCPVCEGCKLDSRALGEDISVLECGKCGGLWLGHELFGRLQERARRREIAWLNESAVSSPVSAAGQKGALYRRCLVCDKLMNRCNFEKRSGVIVDVCSKDGVWLDLGELDRLLRWIQQGGLSRARKIRERQAERAKVDKLFKYQGPLERAGAQEFGSRAPGDTFISDVVRFLSDTD